MQNCRIHNERLTSIGNCLVYPEGQQKKRKKEKKKKSESCLFRQQLLQHRVISIISYNFLKKFSTASDIVYCSWLLFLAYYSIEHVFFFYDSCVTVEKRRIFEVFLLLILTVNKYGRQKTISKRLDGRLF